MAGDLQNLCIGKHFWKQEISKMKALHLIIIGLVLAGCSSEVDKCVDAYMKSSEDYWRREGITGDQLRTERLKLLASARYGCLQAANGTRN